MKRKYDKNLVVLIVLAVLIFMCPTMLWACGNKEELLDVQESDLIRNESNDASTSAENDTESDFAGDLSQDRKIIVIHILGEIKHPGVYEFAEGSRVVDAVIMAGGYTKEACSSWLNQARIMQDGEQIYVPSVQEVQRWKQSGLLSADVESLQEEPDEKEGKLNLNQATIEELMTLPGIGEAKATKIVEYRKQNGNFTSIEDLLLIPGIKEGIYNQIKDLVEI